MHSGPILFWATPLSKVDAHGRPGHGARRAGVWSRGGGSSAGRGCAAAPAAAGCARARCRDGGVCARGRRGARGARQRAGGGGWLVGRALGRRARVAGVARLAVRDRVGARLGRGQRAADADVAGRPPPAAPTTPRRRRQRRLAVAGRWRRRRQDDVHAEHEGVDQVHRDVRRAWAPVPWATDYAGIVEPTATVADRLRRLLGLRPQGRERDLPVDLRRRRDRDGQDRGRRSS